MASLFAEPTGLARVWSRLSMPVNPVAAADALAGVRPPAARRLLAVALAASPEADQFLEDLPKMLRSLAVSTTSRPVRCDGEIRGPVIWSATMAARAASPGAGAVFICASPARAFDTDENRVLVAALLRLLRAARTAEVDADVSAPAHHRPLAADVRRARANGEQARRGLEHRSLQSVSRTTISGRMLQKARTGTKAGVLHSAVQMLARSWAEVGADDLSPFVDAATREEHLLLADVLDLLAEQDLLPSKLRVVDGMLVGGPLTYAHPRGEAVSAGAPPGITVNGRRVTHL